MSKKQIYKDRKLTGTEAQHRFQDAAAVIDKDMDEAFQLVDIKRKAKGSKSLRDFIDTYMIGFVLEEKPSPMTYKAVEELATSLLDCRPVQIQLPRGSGKTTFAAIAVLYLLATAKRKFAVIVSQNARSATNILSDIWRMVDEESAFSIDYPEMCKPFQLCNGGFRRKQIYHGKSTNLTKNSTNLVFPRLVDENGVDLPTSGAAICTRGVTSGIRGLKLPAPTGRPDVVLLDDLLDAKSAASEDTTEKLFDIIRKDIFNLSAGKKLGVVMTSTPLLPDDLTDKIKNDKSWRTIRYPAIVKWPTDMVKHPDDGLWHHYFELFDSENLQNAKHKGSLAYYKEHRDEMDAGAELFQSRFKKSDGHISGLQALLEKRHVIGTDAFQAEMQLAPIKYSLALEITPADIMKNELTEAARCVLPEGFQFAVASSDLNLSFCISTTIVGFKADGTAHIMAHLFKKCAIGGRVADAEYNRKVYEVLVEHGQEIARLGVPLKGWAIDCNGLPYDAVTSFCRESHRLTGLSACGFIGKASHLYNPYLRSKLRTDIARTVLCGDEREHLKSGAGKRWVYWDSDFYRERVQSGFLKPIGLAGCVTIYKGAEGEHRDYARQICAEKLKAKRRRADGRDEYTWKTHPDHDMLDSTAQAFACAAQFGISSANFDAGVTAAANRVAILRSRKKHKRIRFV